MIIGFLCDPACSAVLCCGCIFGVIGIWVSAARPEYYIFKYICNWVWIHVEFIYIHVSASKSNNAIDLSCKNILAKHTIKTFKQKWDDICNQVGPIICWEWHGPYVSDIYNACRLIILQTQLSVQKCYFSDIFWNFHSPKTWKIIMKT